MKKSILLILIIGLSTNIWAYDFTLNGIFYNIISSTSPYKVEVTMESNTGNNYSGTVVIPSTVTYKSNTYSVTSIGSYAFAASTSLTSVTIPSSVTSIKAWAFTSCSSLASVNIPAAVDSIGDGIFWGCQSLASVTIPASVRKIGDYVFFACTGLTQINVDAANTNYSTDNGFLYNKSKSVLLAYPPGRPDNTYTIASFVDTIANCAFGYCNNLTSITIPSTVTYITGHAFIMCNNISSVYIPSSVEYFNNNPFYGCSGMTAVNVDPANQFNESVDGILFKKGLTTIIYYPPAKTGNSYIIPSSVNYIRSGAFMNCLNLNSVTIPASVETIRSGMLEGCSNLTTINVYKVTPVDLTSTLSGEDSNDVFKGVDTLNCVLHVPVGSKNAYASAYQWKGFAHIVEGFSSEVLSEKVSTLKITKIDGQIMISGFSQGETITIITLQGIVLYSEKMTETTLKLYLPVSGMYVLKTDNECLKFVY